MDNLTRLTLELCKLPTETPWLEFKCNNYTPDTIGKNISALANAATIAEKKRAFMLWGIDDATHEIVGTDYNLQTLKHGGQEIESWLRNLLSLNTEFEFQQIEIDGKKVGLLTIYKAESTPVTFKKCAYIRVGSYTKQLKEFPKLEAQLWDKLRNTSFEDGFVKQDLTIPQVTQLLHVSTYFDTLNMPYPSDIKEILHYLEHESLVVRQENALYAITNMGAILLAKDLNDFPRLNRKAVRLVQYADNNRLHIQKELTLKKGYAATLGDIVQFIATMLPGREELVGAQRQVHTVYPALALREAIANALIHQDFYITGAGPLIEIFTERVEITNPGTPLIDIARIIDSPPKSRNEKLASLMRRFGLCEELGTGWDKIIISCEAATLPAPKILLYDESTKVTFFSKRSYAAIPQEERLSACYLHACIKFVQGEQMTNASLRERFGLPQTASGGISRLIRDANEKQLIKPLEPNTAPRHMKYIPYWG